MNSALDPIMTKLFDIENPTIRRTLLIVSIPVLISVAFGSLIVGSLFRAFSVFMVEIKKLLFNNIQWFVMLVMFIWEGSET